jgi:protein TonB
MIPRRFDASRIYTPRTIPKTIAMIRDLPPALPASGAVGGIPGGLPGGQVGGVLGGILGSLPSAAPAPPTPVKPTAPPKPSPPPKVLRVGGNVEAARLISAPHPNYPALAKQARVEGTVRMEAVIGKDGHIKNLTVVSGNPLLISAALNAVKQWVYRPTYLNKQPVQVDTEVDVHFQLSS